MLAGIGISNVINRRLDKRRTSDARKSAYVAGNDWYVLKCAPSCPPDKQVHARGGLAYCSYLGGGEPWNYQAYTIPNLSADLADSGLVTVKEVDIVTHTITYSGEVTFATPNWYKVFVLLLNLPAEAVEPIVSDWTFWLWGTGTEIETASEAESHMEWDTLVESRPWQNFYTTPRYHGYPLCGLILRNDGTTGAGCNILPVGVMNRGQSYMWPRDVRPRRYIAR